jgi:glutamine---fructose-6-phosphate transaminase (isomerizing)
MCGIVGAVSKREISDILLEGLKRLEYRGYDSAGVAIVNAQGKIERMRCEGKVERLVQALNNTPLHGKAGIAHTRWATHGKPSEPNAHPHMSGEGLALVHNGIIENYQNLKDILLKKDYVFTSETDSEVIVHLIAEQLKNSHSVLEAVQKTLPLLKGAFALSVVSISEPDNIVVARVGSPLVIGLGIGENFVGSDVLALQPVTNRFIFLEEGDLAEISVDKIRIIDANNKVVERTIHEYTKGQDSAEKGKYRHFMEKEIFEQPEAIAATLEGRISQDKVLENIFGLQSNDIFKNVENIQIVACGTSFHSGLVARYWFEAIAGIPCQVEVASEYRYRSKVIPRNSLLVTISQSGETADTLAALKEVKDRYIASLVICNVYGSSLVRESVLTFMTNAGPEIGVASTKAFTTQLVALFLLVLTFAKIKGLKASEEAEYVKELKKLPGYFQTSLALSKNIEKMAEKFAEKQHALFLGRGVQYPVAMEGALKLKEISYIHAEAYPAGELKHGPLALVDKDMPVITIAPNDDLYEKLKSNLQEVAARGGELFLFLDEKLAAKEQLHHHLIYMPSVPDCLAPLVYTVPLQLLAYYVALIKGTDVDQPRNLAKSVTVE